MMKLIKIRRTAILLLVFFIVLVGGCVAPGSPDDSAEAVYANFKKWKREQIAAGKGEYMASVYESLRVGKYDEAIVQCEELREVRPDDPVIYTLEGYAYKFKKEFPVAINRFSSAISIDNTRGVPYFLRAQSYFQVGWDKKSLDDFESGMGSRDFSAQLVNFYRKIDAEGNKDLTEEAMNGIIFQYRALAYSRLGQTSLAIASADIAIREVPNNADLYYTRGVLYRSQQKYGAAYNDFEKVIELDPDLAVAWNDAGGINIALGSYNKAVINLQKATELEPDNIGYLTNYGFAYWLQGNQVKAFELMGKALRGEPVYTTYYHLAYFNHLNGQQEKALEYNKKAYELNNDLLKNRASVLNSTPASSPTREFYKDELATARIYIETGQAPAAVSHQSRLPTFEITGITLAPDPVPVNKSFDFHVSFDVDIPGSQDHIIPTVLNFKILRGSKVLHTSEPYSINANNGGSKKWTLHMNPVRSKGTYTIQVTIKYTNMVSEKSTKLLIN